MNGRFDDHPRTSVDTSARLSGSIEDGKTSLFRFLDHPAAYAVGASIITVLSAGTTLIAPILLGPESFGSFALLTTFFQLAARGDMGLSQLADRELASGLSSRVDAIAILRARWLLAAFLAVIIVPVVIYHLSGYSALKPIDIGLTLVGGLLAMVAVGPVTVYRASSRLRQFTVLALALQAGMTLPRLAGLYISGSTGCFFVLLVWYAVFSCLFAWPRKQENFAIAPLLKLIQEALPLFVFSTSWLVFLFANRWFASYLSAPLPFGYFAFGANFSYIAVGTLGAIAQAFYPRVLSEIANSNNLSGSPTLVRHMIILIISLTIPLIIGMPVMAMLIRYIFPKFLNAAPVTVILLISVIPLSVATWILPISISMAKRPLRDGAVLMIPSFLLLYSLMSFGQSIDGINGQASGCDATAIIVTVLLIVLLGLQKGFEYRQAIRVILAMVLATALLIVECQMVLAMSTSTTPERPEPSYVSTLSKTHASLHGRILFNDDFDTLRLVGRDLPGFWEPAYPSGSRNNSENHELQYYIDPRMGHDSEEVRAQSPFEIKDGVLSIIAKLARSGDVKSIHGYRYISGMLNSSKSFSFTYGYLEMRARLPKGTGLWPAFWLLPVRQGWPPEIDVMEAIGGRTDRYSVAIHSNDPSQNFERFLFSDTGDLSQNFNIYAMRWSDETIEWYFNGHRVATVRTPPDFRQPMYMLINLAIGGQWAGAPDDALAFPARFDIDYIRLYALD